MDIETIKKERRDYYRILGDTFEEHKPLDIDHDIGNEPSCELCKRHNLLNRILKEQEELLNANDKLVTPPAKSTKTIRYSIVEDDMEDSFIVGANSIKSVKEANPTKKVTPISDKELDDFYVETGKNTVVSLTTLKSENRTGAVAKKGLSIGTDTCKRRVEDRFIRYTGNNFDDIVNFCSPFLTTKTKKNKVAVQTTRGSFSIEVGEIIVKNAFGNLEFYNESEFDYLFDIVGTSVWKSLDL